MTNRFLVRSAAGDHLAQSEAEILDWLTHGHCGSGDFVYSERDGSWRAVCELPLIAPLFAIKPAVKLEKPVITVYRLGQGKSFQSGPFTLSTVLEMLHKGELCASSWIFVEGDREWRQVRQVKILREALPQAPRDTPNFTLREATTLHGHTSKRSADVSEGLPLAPPQVLEDLSIDALQVGVNENTAKIIPPVEMVFAPAPESASQAELSVPDRPTATATLTAALPMNDSAPEAEPPPPPKVEFVPIPNFSGTGVDSSEVTGSNASAAVSPSFEEFNKEEFSVQLATRVSTPSLAVAPPPAPPPLSAEDNNVFLEEVPLEEQTKAVSKLGLALPPTETSATAFPPPPPPRTGKTQVTTLPPPPKMVPRIPAKEEQFDGLTVEISAEPIWMVKSEKSDRITGPYTFQQVLDLLRTGRLTKEDKVSKGNSHRFNKISQQFEFNVNFSIERVVEGGVEREKIVVKRRHPRVAYITDVHLSKIGKSWLATCVNMSAGGILLEGPDMELNLGDVVELVIMPALIPRKICVSAQLIGKISKRPAGYAFRFTNLDREDKEEIEHFVLEALKKEKAMGM